MVLDDEEGIASLCERVLKKAGFEVIAITNPQQGIKVLQQARIDLLLVDIRMPEVDGFHVMERARMHQPDLAIVMMTGYGTIETAIQALRLGANGLILKPFEQTDALIESVNQALLENERKRELSRLEALRPLIQVSQSLFHETRTAELQDLILDSVSTHLHCEHCGIYRRSGKDRLLALVASQGAPPPAETSDFDGGPVARTDAWWSPMIAKREGQDDPKMRAFLDEHNYATLMCVPAQKEADSRSVIFAARSSGEPDFSEADMEMFSILARQASAALENARLLEDLRETLGQVEASQLALIQAEKMAAIGRLTASIAHEVNNPLQAVQNCLHLIGREDLDVTKKDFYMNLAQDELDRLMGTIREMLDFYRPSQQSREFTDVNQLIQSVLALLEKQLQKQGINVEMDMARQLPRVQMARNQIQQVFFNIVLNAMEAMPTGGEIAITSWRLEDQVAVTFHDTGPGVPDDVRPSIFEPFNSTKKQGTGLGLSVSYSIVDAHGGTLELSNSTEKNGETGAKFRVVLPIVEAT
jgi:signal transduction histidine kinase/FixJ family two-component response regulator